MNVSIIIPVYNSSLMLVELCERIFKIMKKLNLQNNFELILINDYSFDDSWQKIKHLSNQNFYIKGINLSENFGQHNAIMAGLNNCSGEFIITIDDDLQHPPEYIPAILKELNNIVSSFILDKPLKVYMSSFRGFTKTINQKLINFKEKDIYLDGLIIKYTKNIAMITVDHQERKIGESNYNFKKLFILWSNMILNFSFFPFRVASIFGITLKIFIKLFRKKSGKPQFIIKEIINGKK